jgi:hypothetical protein
VSLLAAGFLALLALFTGFALGVWLLSIAQWGELRWQRDLTWQDLRGDVEKTLTIFERHHCGAGECAETLEAPCGNPLCKK